MKVSIYLPLFLMIALNSCAQEAGTAKESDNKHTYEVIKSEKEWRAQLSPLAYNVTREDGTERAFTGEYHDNKKKGDYNCICCGNPLFSSSTKFDSGTGWPSFYQPLSESGVNYIEDLKYGWNRVEVECSRCGAHLGHVFEDGPEPTGKRYCINSVSLDFVAAKEE